MACRRASSHCRFGCLSCSSPAPAAGSPRTWAGGAGTSQGWLLAVWASSRHFHTAGFRCVCRLGARVRRIGAGTLLATAHGPLASPGLRRGLGRSPATSSARAALATAACSMMRQLYRSFLVARASSGAAFTLGTCQLSNTVDCRSLAVQAPGAEACLAYKGCAESGSWLLSIASVLLVMICLNWG